MEIKIELCWRGLLFISVMESSQCTLLTILRTSGLTKSRDKLLSPPQGSSIVGYYFSVSAHWLKGGLPEALVSKQQGGTWSL